MLTLHQATESTKNIFKFSSLTIAAIIIVIMLFKGGVIIKEIIKPTPPTPPTVEFGKLPPIEFPVSLAKNSSSYTIDTVTGVLPVFPDRIKIYKIVSPEPNLLALKRANDLLSKVGFKPSPSYVASNNYQWIIAEGAPKKIVFDVLSYNFKLFSEGFMNNKEVLESKNPLTESGAINTAQSFLSNISATPNDLDDKKTKITLFSIKNSELVKTTSLSSTQLIKVGFFQRDVDGKPIYYSSPPFSTMNVYVGGGKYDNQTIQADFFHQNIGTESATYPIKTADEIFNSLKNGEGFIASNNNPDTVSIKNIFLAYYSGDSKQDYLMPIAVFEGNNGFYAYISAVKEEWIKK